MGGENFVLTRDNMPKLKEQLQIAMRQMADFEKLKSHIDMTVTAEGLRIELTESASGTFFNSGSAKLNNDGAELLIIITTLDSLFDRPSPKLIPSSYHAWRSD